MHEKQKGTDLPSIQALAYLGDARHSLYVRLMLVRQGISKSGELNRRALDFVTAERQAEMYRAVLDMLFDDEREVARRAANSHHLNRPKHASVADYRAATAFEAVVGMLTWLGDEDRLIQILDTAHKEIMK